MITLKSEVLEELTREGIVIVDFYATWCGPCKMLAPVLELFNEKNKTIQVIKVDVDTHRELAMNYSVMSVPTLILFKDGKLVKRQSGYMTEESLTKWTDLK